MKFYIKQKVFSFKDQFKVTDENQKELYQVKGKFMSLSNKLELLNRDGSQVLNSNRKIFSFMPTYFIYDPHGEQLAEIKKKIGIRPKFIIKVQEDDLSVEGSLFGHSFGVVKDGNEVASISKKVMSFGDNYEIEILDERNKELYLFLVIIIDQVLHENKKRVSTNF